MTAFKFYGLRNSILWPRHRGRWQGKRPEGMGEETPLRHLKFSKEMVALSVVLFGTGLTLLIGPWIADPLIGVGLMAVGLAILLTAGIYWACGNEGCY